MEQMRKFNDSLSTFFSQLREEIKAMPDDVVAKTPSKPKMSFNEFFAKLRDDIENDRCEPVKLPYDNSEAKDEEHGIEKENEVIPVTEEAPINEELFDNYETPDWSDITEWGTPADIDEILGYKENGKDDDDLISNKHQDKFTLLQRYMPAAISKGYAAEEGNGYKWLNNNVLLAYFIGVIFCGDSVLIEKGCSPQWCAGTDLFPDDFVKTVFNKDVRQSRSNRVSANAKIKTPPQNYKNIDELIESVKHNSQ